MTQPGEQADRRRRLLVAAICCAVVSTAAGDVFAAGKGATEARDVSRLPDQAPVLFQAGALIAEAQAAVDSTRRAQNLDQAQRLIDAFLLANPTHADAPRAEMQLGIVQVTRGQDLSAEAEAAAENGRRDELLARARETLRSGEKHFNAALEEYANRLKRFHAFIPGDDPRRQEREATKNALLQTMMYQAGVAEQLAATFPSDSDQARDAYRAAADRYERIYKDYRTLLAGLLARLKQGQCCYQLGDTRRALGLYEDILSQPDELESLRRLRVTAMYLSMQCWTSDREKLYELAFSQGEEYLTQARPEEKSWPEWQAVRYFTARGYRLAAGAVGPDRSAEQAEYRTKSRRLAEALAGESGPYQAAARELVAEPTEGPR